MTLRWIVLEDIPDQAVGMAAAIRRCRPVDDIVVLLPDNSGNQHLDVSRDVAAAKGEFAVCSSRAALCAAIERFGSADSVFLNDLNLDGVHRPEDDWLAESLRDQLDKHNQILVVVTTQRRAFVDAEPYKAKLGHKKFVISDHAHVGVSTDADDAPQMYDDFVGRCLAAWELRFGSALEQMWSACDAARWFATPITSSEAAGLPDHVPHNWDSRSLYGAIRSADTDLTSFSEDGDLAGEHRARVRHVPMFKWFPDEWWGDAKSVSHLHDVLKTLSGETFCKKGRFLSVGAVWLLAGSAWDALARSGNSRFKMTPNPFRVENHGFWRDSELAATSAIPAQQTDRAKRCVEELYGFFLRAFVHQAHGDAGDGTATVTKAELSLHGRKLIIDMSWPLTTMIAKIDLEVDRWSSGATRGPGAEPASLGDAAGPFVRFLQRWLVGSNQIGARSSFWLESRPSGCRLTVMVGN